MYVSMTNSRLREEKYSFQIVCISVCIVMHFTYTIRTDRHLYNFKIKFNLKFFLFFLKQIQHQKQRKTDNSTHHAPGSIKTR